VLQRIMEGGEEVLSAASPSWPEGWARELQL
jgi:hypothetical protein